MTESRPYEETICPLIYSKLLAALLEKRLEKGESSTLLESDLDNMEKGSKCLGPECQMYNKNFRGCGLRSK